MAKKYTGQNKKSFQLTYYCSFYWISLILLVKSKSSMPLSTRNHLVITFFNGDMHQQKARIHEIIDKWIFLTLTIKLSKHYDVYACHTYLFGYLNHLFAITCIKKLIGIWWKDSFSKCALFFSLISQFSRHILNSSYSGGGLNLTLFFNLQGIEKLNIIIENTD